MSEESRFMQDRIENLTIERHDLRREISKLQSEAKAMSEHILKLEEEIFELRKEEKNAK